MTKKLRVIAINKSFSTSGIDQTPLDSDRALFDCDVVVIRPQMFPRPYGSKDVLNHLRSVMYTKKRELDRLLEQGGVLVVILDAPDNYAVSMGYTRGRPVEERVSNYEFLDADFADC